MAELVLVQQGLEATNVHLILLITLLVLFCALFFSRLRFFCHLSSPLIFYLLPFHSLPRSSILFTSLHFSSLLFPSLLSSSLPFSSLLFSSLLFSSLLSSPLLFPSLLSSSLLKGDHGHKESTALTTHHTCILKSWH
jgi:hypothetical protein